MRATEYKTLRDARLRKLAEYTGKTVEFDHGFLIERLPSTGVRKLTGDYYPTHASEIATLDAMLWAVETANADTGARIAAVQSAWEAFKDDDGDGYEPLSFAIENL